MLHWVLNRPNVDKFAEKRMKENMREPSQNKHDFISLKYLLTIVPGATQGPGAAAVEKATMS